MKPDCPVCAGSGWVCENHRDRPWLDPPAGCLCGARARCPRCNTFPDESVPDVSTSQFDTIEEIAAGMFERKLN